MALPSFYFMTGRVLDLWCILTIGGQGQQVKVSSIVTEWLKCSCIVCVVFVAITTTITIISTNTITSSLTRFSTDC